MPDSASHAKGERQQRETLGLVGGICDFTHHALHDANIAVKKTSNASTGCKA